MSEHKRTSSESIFLHHKNVNCNLKLLTAQQKL